MIIFEYFLVFLESFLIFYTFMNLFDIDFNKKQLFIFAILDSSTALLIKKNIYILFSLPHGTHVLICIVTMSIYLKLILRNISFIKAIIIPFLTYVIYFATDSILLLKLSQYFSISINTIKTNPFAIFFLVLIENTGILLILLLNKYFGLKLKF